MGGMLGDDVVVVVVMVFGGGIKKLKGEEEGGGDFRGRMFLLPLPFLPVRYFVSRVKGLYH